MVLLNLAVVLIRATRRHLPEDDNHHSHRRGNLKSYLACDYSSATTARQNPDLNSCFQSFFVTNEVSYIFVLVAVL
jgi:hypothetical protein